MSVRAYKIIEIKHEDTPTFNLWHDNWIMDNVAMGGLDEYGQGLLYIEKVNLENALGELDKCDNFDGKEDTINTIKKMIEDCDEYGVEYYCM